jgi:Family of unknown function (DUF6159)
MGRFGRGLALTKQSWSIVRTDRSLLVFPIVSGVIALLLAVVFGGGALAVLDSSTPAAVVIGVVGAYLLVLATVFCNVALTACAARALEGADTTPGEGFAAARARFGPITGWAGLQLVVGALITALQAVLREGAGQLVSFLVGSLANLAWNVATFFVVPVIALEGLGPKAALQRSLGVIRQRWGEGVTGTFAIGGLVFLFAFLPGAALFAAGLALGGVAGDVLIAAGVALFVTGAVVQSALTAVFKVALYRFAAEDRVTAPFDRGELEGAFRSRRGHAVAV